MNVGIFFRVEKQKLPTVSCAELDEGTARDGPQERLLVYRRSFSARRW